MMNSLSTSTACTATVDSSQGSTRIEQSFAKAVRLFM